MKFLEIRRLKMPGGAILAALLGLIALQQLIDLEPDSQLDYALYNAAHTPWFFAVTVLLWVSLGAVRVPDFRYRVLGTLALSLLLATGLEVLQILNSRQASLTDVLFNLTGAAAAFLVLWVYYRQHAAGLYLRGLLLALAVLLLVASFLPVGRLLLLRQLQAAEFPTLISFAHPRYLLLDSLRGDWEILPGLADWPGFEKRRIARISFPREARWPGFSIIEPYENWRGFSWLVLTCFLGGERSMALEIRLESRSNRGMDSVYSLLLQPGENRVRVPLATLAGEHRERLGEVSRLLLFKTAGGKQESLYLAEVGLDP